jgi:tRNA modification GTPase
MRDGTIFALSSARGRAAIAVVRVSGPQAAVAVATIAGRLPAARSVRLAVLRHPLTQETIDRALVLWFEAPASQTGEDVAEFHLHGGPAVVASMLAALAAIPGCVSAEPGEFTRRAYEHGKLDLSEAEGIGDLVAAQTASQHRQALRQAGGEFARLVEGWAARLTRLLAHLEAAIDFADEDLPADLASSAASGAAALEMEIARHLADGRRGEILRDGLSVAITGPPNSGKSSLLNALAGREAAIVSAVAGTTRDVIEVHLDLGGVAFVLADTAGLRASEDPIEAEGIRRARARAESADLRLLVLDPALTLPTPGPDERQITVWNKADLPGRASPPDWPGEAVQVSAMTGQGMQDLVSLLGARAESLLAGDPPVITRARHRAALAETAAALARAGLVGEPALVAEDLRLALRALGRITGRVDVEDLLDVIFRDFCIGK